MHGLLGVLSYVRSMILTPEECRAIAGAMMSVRASWTMQDVMVVTLAVARLLGRLDGLEMT